MFFEGAPGVSKTSYLEAFAASVGLPCEVLSGAERGDGAFGVIPVPDMATGTNRYFKPDWAEAFGDGGLVFLDEITSNPPSIQAPCMGLLLDKRIGNHRFGPRVRVFAACNPPSIATNGFELSLPLKNRGGWLKWAAPTVEEHVDYMLGRVNNSRLPCIDAEEEELRVESEWPEAFANAIGLETRFLLANQDLKNKLPGQELPGGKALAADANAWPSDRTWEMATRALASSTVHNLSAADRDEFVAAFIGDAAYEAFAAFIEEQDLPNTAAVLDGTEKFEHSKRSLDRTGAFLNSALALLKCRVTDEAGKVKHSNRLGTMWRILSSIDKGSRDLVIPVVTDLIRERLTHADGMKLLGEIEPLLRKAGLTAKP